MESASCQQAVFYCDLVLRDLSQLDWGHPKCVIEWEVFFLCEHRSPRAWATQAGRGWPWSGGTAGVSAAKPLLLPTAPTSAASPLAQAPPHEEAPVTNGRSPQALGAALPCHG